MFTNTELERVAYITGDIAMANVCARASDFDDADDAIDLDYVLDSTIQDQIDSKIDSEIAERCPDYEAYKQFFEDCFNRLNSHYPCPSITSDYDQSVIFDAIEKGDTK
jgi:hypothetical protein